MPESTSIRSRGHRGVDCLILATLLLAGLAHAQEGASGRTAGDRTDRERNDGAESRKRTARKTAAGRSAREQFARASEELLDLQARIRASESRLAERRRTSEERLRELTEEGRAAERSVELLKKAVEKRESSLAAAKGAVQTREKEAGRLQHELTGALEPLKQHLDRAVKAIEGGIAWKMAERKAAAEGARESLGQTAAQPFEPLQRVGRLQTEEEALGKLVEAGTVELEVQGEKAAVPAFHLGLLGVVLVSPEGRIAGFAGPGQRLEDGPAAAKGQPEAPKGYVQALEILRRRRAPGIVDLYIPSLPVQSSEEAK